jgi:hypothetical protein
MVERKGHESKCQFDSQSLKVGNHLDIHVWKRHATYHWKFLTRTITLLWILPQSKVYTKNYGLPKWWESQFRELQHGVPRKTQFGLAPMANHRKYYKWGRWWLPLNLGRGESCESVYARGS